MLIGNAPFSGKSDDETFKKIADFNLNQDKKYDSISREARDLITKILVPESDKRMEYEDILAHEWFAEKEEELKHAPELAKLHSCPVEFDKENMSSNPAVAPTQQKKIVKVVNLYSGGVASSKNLDSNSLNK